MKTHKLILSLSLLFTTLDSFSQIPTWNELFRQRRTARRYMARQIIELQLYIKLAKQGYELANDGLGIINNIKKGEFNLHQLFYTSLKTVSPAVRAHPDLKTIINQQSYIQTVLPELKKQIQKNTYFNSEKINYLLSVCNNFQKDTEHLYQQLILILSNNKLELSDDERINQIKQLLTKSTQQLTFINQFSSETLTLLRAMQSDHIENQSLKNLFNLE